MRTLTGLLVAAGVLGSWTSRVDGQIGAVLSFELSTQSDFATGCQGPSQCACPVLLVGPVEGTFELQQLALPLPPIFDYAVQNLQWTINPGTTSAVSVTGSGIYQRDILTGMHSMLLDLDVGGVSQQYLSVGFVAGSSSFPNNFDLGIFAELNVCQYDGFYIFADQAGGGVEFERGDCSNDGAYNIADPIRMLDALFGGMTPACADACDGNDDGSVNIADAVYVLTDLFSGGPPPPAPFGGCGLDPSADALSCGSFASCP